MSRLLVPAFLKTNPLQLMQEFQTGGTGPTLHRFGRTAQHLFVQGYNALA